jgi:hypothetical protein
MTSSAVQKNHIVRKGVRSRRSVEYPKIKDTNPSSDQDDTWDFCRGRRETVRYGAREAPDGPIESFIMDPQSIGFQSPTTYRLEHGHVVDAIETWLPIVSKAIQA